MKDTPNKEHVYCGMKVFWGPVKIKRQSYFMGA